MFKDRQDAARQLAGKLEKFRGQRPLVVGIPRGGVVMASVIAEALEGDLDVVLVHKLRDPVEPEVAVGAIDETGRVTLGEYARMREVSEAYLRHESAVQLDLLRQRRAQYTPRCQPADPAGRVTIVVDDGLATGATMLAALEALRERRPARLVVAAAVAPPDTLEKVGQRADEVVCLESPMLFFAVGQFFSDFRQVEDEEVMHLLKRDQTAKE